MTDNPNFDCWAAKLWLWKNGDHYLAFDSEYPTYGGGDPKTLGEPVGYALLEWETYERLQQATDTQADLTERAREYLDDWFGLGQWPPVHRFVELLTGFAQSERAQRASAYNQLFDDYQKAVREKEAAAAEARKIIQDLVENFGAGGPKANKAFAVATRYLLASPAPQDSRDAQ